MTWLRSPPDKSGATMQTANEKRGERKCSFQGRQRPSCEESPGPHSPAIISSAAGSDVLDNTANTCNIKGEPHVSSEAASSGAQRCWGERKGRKSWRTHRPDDADAPKRVCVSVG